MPCPDVTPLRRNHPLSYLSIRKNGTVVTFHRAFNHRTAHCVEHRRLLCIGCEHSVKRELKRILAVVHVTASRVICKRRRPSVHSAWPHKHTPRGLGKTTWRSTPLSLSPLIAHTGRSMPGRGGRTRANTCTFQRCVEDDDDIAQADEHCFFKSGVSGAVVAHPKR
jgi:hypothetical protein